MSYQDQVYHLLEEQKKNWELLRLNSEGLKNALIKSMNFGDYSVHLQCNPKRILSSGAKVDKESIQKRACFLCEVNRPPEQKGVLFGDDYEILCNPFPIFEKHFTIVKRKHEPQLITGEFGTLLELSKELPDLAVFYNGANCGASAPDHMHFQAGNRGFMPIEAEYEVLSKQYGKAIPSHKQVKIVAVDDGLRRFFTIESKQPVAIEDSFNEIMNYSAHLSSEEEPMLNLLAYYSEGWRVFVFLREKHRPDQYFETGDRNILFSPASVDMGGSMILPLEKDYVKITSTDVEDMYQQLTLAQEKFSLVIEHLTSIYKKQ